MKKASEGEIVTIELPNKMVQLKLTSFDTDIDADELTQIHYHNIAGEIMTSSVALNRLGNLQAEMDNLLNDKKLDFEIFFAHEEEKYRKSLVKKIVTSRSERYEDPTDNEIKQAIIRTPEYKVKKLHLFQLQKNKQIVDSLYWSMKDKCDKINRITDKIRPEEFEKDILEGSVNGVMISLKKKAIK